MFGGPAAEADEGREADEDHAQEPPAGLRCSGSFINFFIDHFCFLFWVFFRSGG